MTSIANDIIEIFSYRCGQPFNVSHVAYVLQQDEPDVWAALSELVGQGRAVYIEGDVFQRPRPSQPESAAA